MSILATFVTSDVVDHTWSYHSGDFAGAAAPRGGARAIAEKNREAVGMPVVRLEQQDAVGHIILDRPPANSYDRGFMEDLDAAIEQARADDGVKAIVVRSASERFFSAGADVSFFARTGLDEQTAFVVCANGAIDKLEATPKVVVAAINGHCLGGGL
ncbi:MAG: enoyl-CoA hydratase/isomerase family protein, partial [Chloroflexi bacterium]|nr:enoyl-CoA hydratase/isomerase family protein [Chloroflexota bacterium]